MTNPNEVMNKLHGSVKRYDNPTEPVIKEGWDAQVAPNQNIGSFRRSLHKLRIILSKLVK